MSGIAGGKDYEAMNDMALAEHAIELGFPALCARWKKAPIITKLEAL